MKLKGMLSLLLLKDIKEKDPWLPGVRSTGGVNKQVEHRGFLGW